MINQIDLRLEARQKLFSGHYGLTRIKEFVPISWLYFFQCSSRICYEIQKLFVGDRVAIIPPTALIAVYTVVFSQIMRVHIPGDGGFYFFGLFLCSGLLTWIFSVL